MVVCRVGVGLVYGWAATLHRRIPLSMRVLSVWCRVCRVYPTPRVRYEKDDKRRTGKQPYTGAAS